MLESKDHLILYYVSPTLSTMASEALSHILVHLIPTITDELEQILLFPFGA